MTKSRNFVVLTGLVLVLAGCQWPLNLGGPASGIRLTLTVTEPSFRGLESGSRLLLSNAATVTLAVLLDGDQIKTITQSRESDSVSFELLLEPLKTYQIQATARDADGVPLFYGETELALTGDQTGSLYLLPVENQATIAAAEQLAGAGIGSFSALALGEMVTLRGDFGTTATAFTFSSLPTGLTAYVQNIDGTPLSVTTADPVLEKGDLSEGSQFLVTYFNESEPSPAAMSTVGTYTIPLQSFTLSGPSTLGTGSSVTLTAINLFPANATQVDSSDFTWTSSDPTLTLATINASGIVSALLPGKVDFTASYGGVTPATLSITLTPTQFLVKNLDGGELPPAPASTMALAGQLGQAGQTDQLWALTSDLTVLQFSGGTWKPSTLPNVPAGVKWLAANPDGTLMAAAPNGVYQLDGGFWKAHSSAPAAATFTGLAFVQGVLWASGTDGRLWSWQGGVWKQESIVLPTGFQALGGSSQLLALAGTKVVAFDGSTWNPVLDAPAQSQALTSAFSSTLILVVR